MIQSNTTQSSSNSHYYSSTTNGKSFEDIMSEQMASQHIDLKLENTKDENLSTLPEETRNRIGTLPPPRNPQQVPVSTSGRPKIDYSKLGVDDFQKLKLIGKGDVGKVWLVLLKGTDLYFAMKILNKEEMISRNKVKRVLTEREILATVDHPFITTLFCSFQTKENLYFILEYCAGGEFFKILKKQPSKCLPEATVRFYAAEVVLALEYLHMKGFLYRDLKPENLLLHHSGHIRLTDFDLSKQSIQQVTPTLVKSFFSSQKQSIVDLKQIQEFDSFLGTEEYLSPEILSGKKHNSCVDFWALGILLYEMLFGFTPFKGSTQRETFFNILNNTVSFPSKTAYPVSKQAKDLIIQLLITDKDKRLGSQHGISEIKIHSFFKEVNWALIRNEIPPIIPKLQSKLDTSYFNQYRTSPQEDEDEDEQTIKENEEESIDNPFKNFKFQTKKDIEIFNGSTNNNTN